jgi:ribonuclease HI
LDIYVDGSYCPLTNRSGIGITYKNTSLPIRAKGSLSAEIIAIIRALLMARPGDVIYSDCLVAIHGFRRNRLIVRHESLCENAYAVYNSRRKHIGLRKVKRENNREADALARQARKTIKHENKEE